MVDTNVRPNGPKNNKWYWKNCPGETNHPWTEWRNATWCLINYSQIAANHHRERNFETLACLTENAHEQCDMKSCIIRFDFARLAVKWPHGNHNNNKNTKRKLKHNTKQPTINYEMRMDIHNLYLLARNSSWPQINSLGPFSTHFWQQHHFAEHRIKHNRCNQFALGPLVHAIVLATFTNTFVTTSANSLCKPFTLHALEMKTSSFFKCGPCVSSISCGLLLLLFANQCENIFVLKILRAYRFCTACIQLCFC